MASTQVILEDNGDLHLVIKNWEHLEFDDFYDMNEESYNFSSLIATTTKTEDNLQRIYKLEPDSDSEINTQESPEISLRLSDDDDDDDIVDLACTVDNKIQEIMASTSKGSTSSLLSKNTISSIVNIQNDSNNDCNLNANNNNCDIYKTTSGSSGNILLHGINNKIVPLKLNASRASRLSSIYSDDITNINPVTTATAVNKIAQTVTLKDMISPNAATSSLESNISTVTNENAIIFPTPKTLPIKSIKPMLSKTRRMSTFPGQIANKKMSSVKIPPKSAISKSITNNSSKKQGKFETSTISFELKQNSAKLTNIFDKKCSPIMLNQEPDKFISFSDIINNSLQTAANNSTCTKTITDTDPPTIMATTSSTNLLSYADLNASKATKRSTIFTELCNFELDVTEKPLTSRYNTRSYISKNKSNAHVLNNEHISNNSNDKNDCSSSHNNNNNDDNNSDNILKECAALKRMNRINNRKKPLLKNKIIERIKLSPRTKTRSKSLTVGKNGPGKSRRLSLTLNSQEKFMSHELSKISVLQDPNELKEKEEKNGQKVLSLPSSTSDLSESLCATSSKTEIEQEKISLLCDEKISTSSKSWESFDDNSPSRIGVECDNVSYEYDEGNNKPNTVSQIGEIIIIDDDNNKKYPSQQDEIRDDVALSIAKKNVDKNVIELLHENPAFNFLDWSEDGIGKTKDCKIDFEVNELGLLEILEKSKNDVNDTLKLLATSSNDCHIENNTIQNLSHRIRGNKYQDTLYYSEPLYTCDICKKQSSTIDFLTPNYCSLECVNIFKNKSNNNNSNNTEPTVSNIDANERYLREYLQRGKTVPNKKSNGNKLSNIVLPSTSSANINLRNNRERENVKTFNWEVYLKSLNAIPAPMKLFLNPLPRDTNLFKQGMKLEAIDPENNSLFCVCTVIKTKGYRIKLHFDGFSDFYDFWVNADSMDIFPPGWCARTNRVLQPPKGTDPKSFTWTSYIRKTKSVSAPRSLFKHLNSSFDSNPFAIGMRLEAEDLKNTRKICVASVADVLDNRILIHFDGWDNCYDFWTDIYSPFIHPVNWHQKCGFSIVTPPDWEGVFTWQEYINTLQCEIATPDMFKPRERIPFAIGMKLEVVDKKNPTLIRPATIIMLDEYEIKVLFDGWPIDYSFWVIDDSPDIHPINWCQITGHELEPPPGYGDISKKSRCPIPNCRGIGNSKNSYIEHHSNIDSCPYVLKNWNKNIDGTGRFEENKTSIKIKQPLKRKNETEITTSKPSKILKCKNKNKNNKNKKSTENKRIKKKNNETNNSLKKSNSSKSIIEINDDDDDDDDKMEETNKQNNNNNDSNDHNKNNNNSNDNNEINGQNITNVEDNNNQNDNNKHENFHIFVSKKALCDYGPRLRLSHEVWTSNSERVCGNLISKITKNPLKWNSREVSAHIRKLRGCGPEAGIFLDNRIDGTAFLSLRQSDLIDLLKLKIGPTIKIYNLILQLRELYYTKYSNEKKKKKK